MKATALRIVSASMLLLLAACQGASERPYGNWLYDAPNLVSAPHKS